jgi:hypothetical protein
MEVRGAMGSQSELLGQPYKPSLIDRILLVGKTIASAHRISKNSVVFVCTGKHNCVYVKYSYPGNVQYHKIAFDEIGNHIEILQEAKRVLDDRP